MKKLLILSLAVASFAGCSSDAAGPKRVDSDAVKDRASFCSSWADAACNEDAVDACQAPDEESCMAAQKAYCVDRIPNGYVPTNATKCIKAVKNAYSDAELTKDELDLVLNLAGDCSQLVKGGVSSGGMCTLSTECDTTTGYSCVIKPGDVSGTCQIAKVQEPAAKCKGLDQVCQSGTYCDEGGHCVDTEAEHADCAYDAMCDASLRCDFSDSTDGTTGTCEKKVARGKPCATSDECVTGICLQASTASKCADYVGLTFGSPYCADLGGA